MSEVPPPMTPPHTQRPPRRWRKRKIVLGCLAIPTLIVLGAGGWLWWRLSLKPNLTTDYIALLNEHARSVPEEDRAWPLMSELIADLEAQGEPYMSVRSFAPRDASPVELEDYEAGQDFVRRRRDVVERLWEIAGTKRYGFVHGTDVYPVQSAEVREQYEMLRDDPLSVKLLDLLLPHLVPVRRLGVVLLVDAENAFHEGDRDRATKNFIALCGLSRLLQDNPDSQITNLMAYYLVANTCLQTRHMLADHNDGWSTEQFRTIRNSLQTSLSQPSFKTDRYVALDTIQRIYSDSGLGSGRITRSGLNELRGVLTGTHLDPADEWYNVFRHLGAASREEVEQAYDDLYDIAEAESAEPFHERDFSFNDLVIIQRAQTLGIGDPGSLLVQTVLGPVNRVNQTHARVSQLRDVTITLLALHEHHLEHGSYPDSLSVLVPDYLDKLPTDMFNGEPLRYRLEPDGSFRLWSIGNDRDDDGGVHHHRADDPVMLRTDGSQVEPIDAEEIDPEDQSYVVVDADFVFWPRGG